LKTAEQIRTEAAEAAKADMVVLMSHHQLVSGDPCDCLRCLEHLAQQYRWHWERIERDATTYWAGDIPIPAQAAQQWPMFVPAPEAPQHVCEPTDGSSVLCCKHCGKVLPQIAPIVTVGP
jgi:hypothetical protein